MTKHLLESVEDVRRAVIAAATRLMASKGYNATSLQEIADAAGVSKPTVLYHFPSKELIRAAVFEGMLDHWRDALPGLLMAATAGVDRYDAIYGELSRFFRARQQFAQLVLRETLDRPEETRRLLRDALRPWLAAIASAVRDGVQNQMNQPDVDAEFYVLLVLHIVVFTSAISDVASVVPVEAGDHEARYHRELDRMMKSSLFTESMLRGRRPSGD